MIRINVIIDSMITMSFDHTKKEKTMTLYWQISHNDRDCIDWKFQDIEMNLLI